MTGVILTHVFGMADSAKYTMTVRRILNKLIARVGLASVLAATAKEHQRLVHYVERVRRKKRNAKERARLLLQLKGISTSGEDAASKPENVPAEGDSDFDADEDSDLEDRGQSGDAEM